METDRGKSCIRTCTLGKIKMTKRNCDSVQEKTMKVVQDLLLEKLSEGKSSSLIICKNELKYFEAIKDYPRGEIENKGKMVVQFGNGWMELDFKLVGNEVHEELHYKIEKALEEQKPKYYKVKQVRVHNSYLCSRHAYSKEELEAGQLYIKLEKPAQQSQGEFRMPEPYTLGVSEWLIEPLLEDMLVEGKK